MQQLTGPEPEGFMANTLPARLADRLPPQHIEAEKGLLGSCFLEANVVDEVIELGFQAEDMYRDAHQVLWRAVVHCHETGKPTEILAVEEELKRRKQWDSVGGIDYLSEIIESVPHSANGKYYAQIVMMKATSRNLIETSLQTINDCYSNQYAADELAFRAEERLFAVTERNAGGNLWTPGQLVDEGTARLQLRDEGVQSGVPMGLVDVDQRTGGMKPGNLVLVGARPSMGKTALGMCALESLASKQELVLMFSVEMGRQEIADRLVCQIAAVDGQRFQFSQTMSHEERKRINQAYGKILNSTFLLDDTSPRDPSQIAAIARRVKRKQPLSLVIVDYVNLLSMPGFSDEQRQEKVAAISRRMKQMAKELFIPVMLLCQLNRGVENREVKRPRLSDLRETGSLEQDADMVFMIHRPEYYDPNDQPGIAEIVIAKNRNGPTGVVNVAFNSQFTRFSNLSNHSNNEQPY